MRPHVISHILTTVDGRIDEPALEVVTACREYEAIHRHFGGNAWLGSEAIMRKYSAASGPFVGDIERGVPAGPQSVFVARQTESYAISVDPNGVRNWITNELAGDHLICLLSEQVSQDYLELLHRLGISYVVSGHKDVDIEAALSELSTHFGIHTLLLKGDSQVSQSAMQAGWVDEVSLLIVPAIASSNIVPSSRDVLHVQGNATMLKLKFVERRNHDILWVRYDVVRRGGDDRSAIPT